MATFGIRLPNRGRQKAELAEAQQNQERARREADAESQRVLSEVQQQYVRAKTSEERLKIYSDGLVPQSEATFRSALSAYQSNRQDFESLLSSFPRCSEPRSWSIGTNSWNTNRRWPNWSALPGWMCHERAQLQTECNGGIKHAAYRRKQVSSGFLDCATTTIALAIVASVLWWRLSHAGAASQPGNRLRKRSPWKLSHKLSNASDSGAGAAGEMQMSNTQDGSACAHSTHAATNAEHRHGAGEG